MKDNYAGFLSELDAFALDMDGTLYIGDGLIGNIADTLSRLREMGKKLVYLTNNSSRSESSYREKLSRLGLWDVRDAVYTSGMAAADYLGRTCPGRRVHLLGTKALKEEFRAAGIALTDGNADVAVLGYDTELTYAKLCAFTTCLRKGAVYLATHPDVNCPAPDEPLPDAGAFMKMIEAATGRTPEAVIGKPNPFMGEELSVRLGIPAGRIAMAGDRIYTDMKFAINCGMKSVLVLSGESSRADAEASGLDFSLVLPSLNHLFL